MPTFTKHADMSLDWPAETTEVSVECAGPGFLEFHTLKSDPDNVWEELLAADRAGDDEEESGSDDNEDAVEAEDNSMPAVDLFSLKEHQLEKIDYYKVLHLKQRPDLTADDVKKAYRKACLKYHPDKTGRGEEDAVFLKVKAAFETLSTQRLAYDSTEMPFNEKLPSEDSTKDFFKEYGPVFERNLHFDQRLLVMPSKNGANKKRNKKNKQNMGGKHKPPSLGDADTPIDKVHEFYDYWTHFESWRDFSLQAARELETEDHLENAESRYEKRWYQKEIDRHAKKLKQQEVIRITTLVERAMAADPRLIQERKRLIEEKEQKQREREQQALDKKKAAEEAAKAEERRIEEEKKQKAEEKQQREKEKKMLRKVKQSFRRQVSGALEELLENEHALEDEVDLICSQLDRTSLSDFTDTLEPKSAADTVNAVRQHAEELRNSPPGEKKEAGTNDSSPAKTNGESTKPAEVSKPKTKAPFTKEELSALAKGVKKFPPGGANRWDQIANYINNSCRPQDPKSKEECIETFNQINKAAAKQRNGTAAPAPAPAAPAPAPEPAAAPATDDSNGWTAEQDQKLQDALGKFPATMDKNERWTNIAKGVPGKSKKECVQRFKEIRNAIKSKK